MNCGGGAWHTTYCAVSTLANGAKLFAHPLDIFSDVSRLPTFTRSINAYNFVRSLGVDETVGTMCAEVLTCKTLSADPSATIHHAEWGSSYVDAGRSSVA